MAPVAPWEGGLRILNWIPAETQAENRALGRLWRQKTGPEKHPKGIGRAMKSCPVSGLMTRETSPIDLFCCLFGVV